MSALSLDLVRRTIAVIVHAYITGNYSPYKVKGTSEASLNSASVSSKFSYNDTKAGVTIEADVYASGEKTVKIGTQYNAVRIKFQNQDKQSGRVVGYAYTADYGTLQFEMVNDEVVVDNARYRVE